MADPGRIRVRIHYSPELNVAAVWIGRRLSFATYVDGAVRWA